MSTLGFSDQSHCAKCFYPFNAKPTITFDSEGICSGCRYHENRSRAGIDWKAREEKLRELLHRAKVLADSKGSQYDCLIPISGGKDSHFQVWLLTQIYGMKPLLVHFNHRFNTFAGIRNLKNLVNKSGLNLVSVSAEIDSAKRISRTMLERVGDLTWHYHAGIMTVPYKVAVNHEIPLIIWGEHGFGELTGVVSLLDYPEFTNWKRKEHDMRGVDPNSLIGINGINQTDVQPYIFPDDEEIERLEIRGIYLSNYIEWNALKQAQSMVERWNFSGIRYKRNRTFNLYSKIEDHANDVHDYLKFLKFGYGRCTDDVSTEIRHGRLRRESGLQLIEEYDEVTPDSLDFYCDYLEISRTQFYEFINPMRDRRVWEINNRGKWQLRKEFIDGRKLMNRDLTDVDSIFESSFRNYYFNPKQPPEKSFESDLNINQTEFLAGE